MLTQGGGGRYGAPHSLIRPFLLGPLPAPPLAQNEYDLDFKSSSPDPSLLLTGDELIAFYKKMISKYPIKTIEDPFDQDDWANWTTFCKDVGTDVQVVGDDLTVTNPVKIKEAVEKGSANCLLLKVNQIGTISESIDAVKVRRGSRRREGGVIFLLLLLLLCSLLVFF